MTTNEIVWCLMTSIIIALSILFGSQQARMPQEDDIRHEYVWHVTSAMLHQSDDYRIYDVTLSSDGIMVFVGSYDHGTECTLGTYWSEHVGAWSPLYYECA